jgi:ribonuclease BN (tRNA processing enzyme)
MNRREAILAASSAAAVAAGWRGAPRPSEGTRLILLGTGGGPRPRKTVSSSAQVIVSDGAAYVIDCGDGVARQLVHADISLRALRHVFITHQHSDHTADYGNLLWLAWTAGLSTPVHTWGPPPLSRMTRQFLAMNAEDIAVRIADEARAPLAPLIVPHDLTNAGPLAVPGPVRVTAAIVDHPPVRPALAYRFDAPDRSIVISGDTRPSPALVELARGADVLVHEALFPSAVDRLVAKVPNAQRLKESILSHHTTAEQAGQIAQDARVKTLVLSHLIPAEDPLVTEADWIAAAATHFAGRIIVGRDLLAI